MSDDVVSSPHIGWVKMEDSRPLSAKEKRQEQLKRWENSATDLECETYTNPKIKVKFDEGAVFLAACSSGDLDEVKKLLNKGADINFANVDGLTALHQACIDGNIDVVKFLVEYGSEIDQEDNEGWTPLHATASCGFMDIAKYLIEKGANVGAVNSEGELPIDTAEDEEMIEYLQKAIDDQGIDVEYARNIEHDILLQDAMQYLTACENSEKPEIYKHPKSGASLLHIAAAKGYNDVIKILIQAGRDVNIRDNDGWTPLHAASHWSQEESAKILADKNADFNIRSKLGQTPFDVADEDMLEYLSELKAEQKNQPNAKDSMVIEPPPIKTEKTETPDVIKAHDVQNGERDGRKTFEVASESSSEDENSKQSTPGKTPYSSKSTYGIEKDSYDSFTNEKNEDVGNFAIRSTNRPGSLSMTSQERRSMVTESSSGSKPIAATQPVQSVTKNNKENGPKTPTTPTSRDVKDNSPAKWRSGLRKTGSFEEKSRVSVHGKEVERSSSYSSRHNEEISSKMEHTRLARVAPILDARQKTKDENETTTVNDTDYQRSTSFGRRKYPTDVTGSSTTSNNAEPSSFKRSISYKKAVGRMESLDNSEEGLEGLSKRLPKFSSISESTNDTAAENDVPSKTADRRRSHLQPVRDEEAEAQRRARSRRERQTRRSTQGVTLDVVEEAMRTIGKMRQQQQQASGDKTPAGDGTSESSKGMRHNDSSSNLYRRVFDDSQPNTSSAAATTPSTFSSSSTSTTSSSNPVTALPSGYIPSDQRVKTNEPSATAESKSYSSSVPSISVQDTQDVEGENQPLIENDATSSSSKSSKQGRRRPRKDRRSTGIQDLKAQPAVETLPKTTASSEEGTAQDSLLSSESIHFRHRRRVLREDKKQRQKLPDEFVSDQLYTSSHSTRKSALTVWSSGKEGIGKLDPDGEDDDDRHRRLVERLTRKIRKKPLEESMNGSNENSNVVKSQDITVAKLDVESSQEVVWGRGPSDQQGVFTTLSPVDKNNEITTTEEAPKQSLVTMFAKSEKTSSSFSAPVREEIAPVEEVQSSVIPVQEEVAKEKIIRVPTALRSSALTDEGKPQSQSPHLENRVLKRHGKSNKELTKTSDDITDPSTAETTQVVAKWAQLVQVLALCVALCFTAVVFYFIVNF